MSRLSPGTILPSPRRVVPRPVAWRRAELTLSRVPRIRPDVRRISWSRSGGSIVPAAPAGVPAAAPGGQGPVPGSADATKRPHMIARLIERPRAPHRTGGRHFLPRSAGHRIPPRPEDRGIGREIW